MTKRERVAVIRDRYFTLFPLAHSYSKTRAKRPKTPAKESPKEPRKIDFSLVGSRHSEFLVNWVRRPNEQLKLTVKPARRRKGELPLTAISNQLQPGSRHLRW
jgi:hypothetical protein